MKLLTFSPSYVITISTAIRSEDECSNRSNLIDWTSSVLGGKAKSRTKAEDICVQHRYELSMNCGRSIDQSHVTAIPRRRIAANCAWSLDGTRVSWKYWSTVHSHISNLTTIMSFFSVLLYETTFLHRSIYQDLVTGLIKVSFQYCAK